MFNFYKRTAIHKAVKEGNLSEFYVAVQASTSSDSWVGWGKGAGGDLGD
jgi:hypothetical protein